MFLSVLCWLMCVGVRPFSVCGQAQVELPSDGVSPLRDFADAPILHSEEVERERRHLHPG